MEILLYFAELQGLLGHYSPLRRGGTLRAASILYLQSSILSSAVYTARMSVLILNHKQVRRLLPMRECIDLMAETLAALARGEAVQPLRKVIPVPNRAGFLALMPGYLGWCGAVGSKIITVFPGNWGSEYDSHQGVILLFEAEHGSLQAVVDASTVTGIRTAAASAAATRALAREDAGDLAILGTGTQAAMHLEAMLLVRRIRRVRVWSRDPENRRRFADRHSMRYGVKVNLAADAREAVEGADIICTTTSAREPVLEGEWIAPGAHINAVGACTPATRELSTTAVVRSSVFTDRLESLMAEAGDFLIPEREGALSGGAVRGEIGQVLAARIPGRTSESEVTLFKSLGLAVEDVACAHFLRKRAIEQRVGTVLGIGGGREE